MMQTVYRDVRFALRQLARQRGFTLTAFVMLALGVGVTIAVFAFVDAALLRPMPYPQPDRLVFVTETTPQIPRANLSYFDYLDWKRMNTVFTALDVFTGRGYMLSTPSGTQLVPGARVSDGFFRTLGVRPVLGRDFEPGEDRPGAPNVVILTYGAWQTRFGGSPDVIGRTLTLSGVAHTVVGVLPQTFQFAPRGRAELWTTLHPSGSCDNRRSCHNLYGIARLKDGVSVADALAETRTIAQQLERQYPDSNRGQGASVLPLSEVIVGDIRPVLLVLFGGAALLLAIGCVNVASLVLLRSEGRRRELAVRKALGASQARLARQFGAEALVLVLIGSLFGLLAADWFMHALARLIPADMLAVSPFLRGVVLSPRSVGAAGLVAIAAATLLTSVPMMHLSSSDLRTDVVDGGRGTASTAWHRLGFKLVIVELAIAVMLLAGAGLLGKSLHRLLSVDLGFAPEGLAVVDLAAPPSRYVGARAAALGQAVVERVTALPGVVSAGIIDVRPVNFNGNTQWIRFVGRPYHGEHNEVLQRDVSPAYFSTLGAVLLRGRQFTDRDGASAPRVAIINRALARKYFPAEDPIGTQIGDTSLSPASIKHIVGIVENIRDGPLDEEIWPAVYYPFAQDADTFFTVVARTSRPAASMVMPLRTAIESIDAEIGTINEGTMSDSINDSPTAYLHRSAAWLVGGFAALALVLGVVGLYGVIAYSVTQRTRELGIRIALGAQRSGVYRLILVEAGSLIAAGIAVGLVCSMVAATLMRRLLFGTAPWDPPTLAIVAIVLAGSACMASFFPARRAARLDPADALRRDA